MESGKMYRAPVTAPWIEDGRWIDGTEARHGRDMDGKPSLNQRTSRLG
jgi:hypothetical protein